MDELGEEAMPGSVTSSSQVLYEDNKIFVGGLSWVTSPESLKSYFSNFGVVTDVVVIRDPVTQRNRGFGFVTFADAAVASAILTVPRHLVDKKEIEAKRAILRNRPLGPYTAKQIFIGGVSQDSTLNDVKEYFAQFGIIEDAALIINRDTHRHRGFGFITFDNEEIVNRICDIHYHNIKDKNVECKKVRPWGAAVASNATNQMIAPQYAQEGGYSHRYSQVHLYGGTPMPPNMPGMPLPPTNYPYGGGPLMYYPSMPNYSQTAWNPMHTFH